MNETKEEVYFGAGCFWNAQLIYDQQEGVLESEVGWCTFPLSSKFPDDQEGKVEVVRLKYDTETTNLQKLVQVFWETHNATHEKNKDELYVERSLLLAKDEDQLKELDSELQKKKRMDPKILTNTTILRKFKRAPEKDQKYYQKN